MKKLAAAALASALLATPSLAGTLAGVTLPDRETTGSIQVAESGATIVHYLGVMPAILLQLPASEWDTRHNVVCGFGSNVEPEHHLAFEKRFCFPLVEGWAMTEGGIVS